MSKDAAPLRVCLVSSNLHAVPPKTYGAVEIQMMEQARGLASLGHEVHVITVGDEAPVACADAIVFHRLGPAYEDRGGRRLGGLVTEQLRFGLRAKQLIRRLQPDVVHYHARYPCLMAVTGPDALTSRFPVLYHAHTWKRAAGMAYPRLSSRHAAYVVGSHVDKLVTQRCHHVIAISEFVRELVVTSTGVPAEKTSLVTNVLDTEVFRRQNVTRRPREILFVGRVAEEKGVHVLIEAMAEVTRRAPQATLNIVGPHSDGTERGGYRRRCEELVTRLNLTDRVRFTGTVANRDLPVLFSQSRMLVVPSLWEGLGLVILEAMACGCPVVGSRTGGIPELIDEGVTGRLVPPGAVEAWAAAIADLLEDDQVAETAASAGPARIALNHTWLAMRDRLDEVYRHVIAAAARAGAER